jgi:hypothetical protein
MASAYRGNTLHELKRFEDALRALNRRWRHGQIAPKRCVVGRASSADVPGEAFAGRVAASLLRQSGFRSW